MQVCFFCGAANSPGKKECHSCGQAFPSAEGSSGPTAATATLEADSGPDGTPAIPPKAHDQDFTARYDEFAGQVEAVRNGKVSREGFSDWLRSMRLKLEQMRDEYVIMVKESGYYQVHSDEVDMGMTGMFDFEEAMDSMELFANGEAEQGVLDSSLLQMWEGNEKVNEALRLNRAFRAQLEEDWGYM